MAKKQILKKRLLDISNLPDYIRPVIDYDGSIITNWYVDSKDLVIYKYLGNGEARIATPYLNKGNSKKTKWKYGYYKVHIGKGLYNFHWVLARAFLPGYEKGLCVDHIDNDSTNNSLSNLQWISRRENTIKYWNSCNEEDRQRYLESYTNGVKKAHSEGKYKEHLEKIDIWRYRGGRVKNENN